MPQLKRLFEFILVVSRDLLFGWVMALTELIQILNASLRACFIRHRLPGRLRKTSNAHCVKISDPAFKRPDPTIYDQYYLMSQGIAVSWDNPDIRIELAGVPVSPHLLKPNTVYELIARIWNNSTEAPVVQMPVDFSYLSFGIGTQVHGIGQTKVSVLGVKGGPNHPAFAQMAWKTPPTPGHYCIQVLLDCFDDMNPNNNLGQTNTNVVSTHSPADFTFQLRNNSLKREEYKFEVDAYVIPPPTPCDHRQAAATPAPGTRYAPGTVLVPPSPHERRNAPQPVGWTISFNPPHPVLAPGEEISVTMTAAPPSIFHGRQPINTNAFDSTGLAGGVTVYVDVP
jgi:hypothetical protein